MPYSSPKVAMLYLICAVCFFQGRTFKTLVQKHFTRDRVFTLVTDLLRSIDDEKKAQDDLIDSFREARLTTHVAPSTSKSPASTPKAKGLIYQPRRRRRYSDVPLIDRIALARKQSLAQSEQDSGRHSALREVKNKQEHELNNNVEEDVLKAIANNQSDKVELKVEENVSYKSERRNVGEDSLNSVKEETLNVQDNELERSPDQETVQEQERTGAPGQESNYTNNDERDLDLERFTHETLYQNQLENTGSLEENSSFKTKLIINNQLNRHENVNRLDSNIRVEEKQGDHSRSQADHNDTHGLFGKSVDCYVEEKDNLGRTSEKTLEDSSVEGTDAFSFDTNSAIDRTHLKSEDVIDAVKTTDVNNHRRESVVRETLNDINKAYDIKNEDRNDECLNGESGIYKAKGEVEIVDNNARFTGISQQESKRIDEEISRNNTDNRVDQERYNYRQREHIIEIEVETDSDESDIEDLMANVNISGLADDLNSSEPNDIDSDDNKDNTGDVEQFSDGDVLTFVSKMDYNGNKKLASAPPKLDPIAEASSESFPTLSKSSSSESRSVIEIQSRHDKRQRSNFGKSESPNINPYIQKRHTYRSNNKNGWCTNSLSQHSEHKVHNGIGDVKLDGDNSKVHHDISNRQSRLKSSGKKSQLISLDLLGVYEDNVDLQKVNLRGFKSRKKKRTEGNSGKPRSRSKSPRKRKTRENRKCDMTTFSPKCSSGSPASLHMEHGRSVSFSRTALSNSRPCTSERSFMGSPYSLITMSDSCRYRNPDRILWDRLDLKPDNCNLANRQTADDCVVKRLPLRDAIKRVRSAKTVPELKQIIDVS